MKGMMVTEKTTNTYGNPDQNFDPLFLSSTKSVSSSTYDNQFTNTQHQRLDYLDQKQRFLEMQRLVSNQIKSITSKNLATNFHQSIHNPEQASEMKNINNNTNANLAILRDPPLRELKK